MTTFRVRSPRFHSHRLAAGERLGCSPCLEVMNEVMDAGSCSQIPFM